MTRKIIEVIRTYHNLTENRSDYFIQILKVLNWLAYLVNLSSYPLSFLNDTICWFNKQLLTIN